MGRTEEGAMADGGSGPTGTVVVVSGADELKRLLGTGSAHAPAAGPAAEGATVDADAPVVTRHEVVIDGVSVAYDAMAGKLEVAVDAPDKPKAKLFYVAYVRADVDSATRPIAFCFNGGPGSSSIWLHMGCLGPRRVKADIGALPPPGAAAEDNPLSVLDCTDLVFVDPVGTGFSRPSDGKGTDYHSVQGDAEAMAEFIRRFTTKYDRWTSPKYLIGESYGTTRAAVVAKLVQERHGVYLTGLVLVSLALKFQTLAFDPGNDLPYVLYVGGYAATAILHGALSPEDPASFVAEAERWAYEVYAPALLRGARLSASERAEIARGLSSRIGLSQAFVERCNLRVALGRYCRELLRERGLTVGRLDARFTGTAPDAAGENLEHDPSMSALQGAYTSALHRELRARLGVKDEEAYEVLNIKVNMAWAWGRDNQYLDVTADLGHALAINDHLRVFVASGVYDLATPPAASDYTIDHLLLGLPAWRREHVVHCKYPAGHMMYAHEPSYAALRRDLERFFRG